MELLVLAVTLWLGFGVGAVVGLLVTGAVDMDPSSELPLGTSDRGSLDPLTKP
jgi:hypothetical protein